MQTELQVSLHSELHLHPTSISVQDGDPDVTSSTANHVLPKKPGMLLFIYIFFYFLIGALDCATLGCRKLHIWLLHKCPMQQKDPHGNGLLGHVKRRKVSSLHYVKSARHVIVHLYFGILIFYFFMTFPNCIMHSLQNFEKITRRVQSKNKDQVFAITFYF